MLWGTICVICLKAHVKSIQGVLGCQSGWCHEPGSYKACPNEAVTSFLCLHKRSVWNCPCLIWCCLPVFNYWEMASKQQQAFRKCVHPCPCYLMGGDTHVLHVACLGEEHARSALESTAMCFPCRYSDPAWRSFTVRALRLAFPRALVPLLLRHSEGCSPGVRK